MRVHPYAMGFERSSALEWILTNGAGGYASSTVAGLNTRKYHGLLVASLSGLSRAVCLQRFDDEVLSGGRSFDLSCIEFSGNFVRSPGIHFLSEFRRSPGEVSFRYHAGGVILEKRVGILRGRNAVLFHYRLVNETDGRIRHVARPHVTFRNIHQLLYENNVDFNTDVGEHEASVSMDGHKLNLSASSGVARPDGTWMRNIFYRRESERGYNAVEDALVPCAFEFELPGHGHMDYNIVVGLDGHEKGVNELPAHSPYRSEDLALMEYSAKSFLVNVGGDETVIAGYHWFGEWGRDAMVSLPGLTLVSGMLDDAGRVLERFLSRVSDGRVLTESETGGPVFRDYDSALWLVDRVFQYVKYAGPTEGRRFVREHWNALSEILGFYSGIERNGLIRHSGGTWMDTLQRDDAVEIQALWYNALRVCQKLEALTGSAFGVPLGKMALDFEKGFMNEYWNGSYLRDCAQDNSFRPNQLFALSLEHPCIDDEKARLILSAVEKRLVTPVGLRTLDPRDGRYKGFYSGNVAERELSYHNGTVWPYLLGPYACALARYGGFEGRKRAENALHRFFSRSLGVYALGSVPEVFDGNAPHRPGGCVSQAWSVGEPLRAYVEDALGRRPPYERVFV